MVTATFAGFTGSPATFTASGRASGQVAETTVTGVVLDNQDIPIEGVTATIEVEGVVLDPVPTAVTNDQGRFTITGAPVGAIRLFVDGSTSVRPGEWPTLEFDFTTVPGQENTIGMPIYLLPMDTENSRIVGGSEDVTLQMKGIPGAELTVFANSVTCPDGSSECQVTWTQVNMERVPMPPPMGSSFMLAWTVQPAGVRFNTPARVCIPNMEMPSGQQVEIFSFDHDLGEFVAVGTATVAEDGSQICSDPGFGIVKSGWGGCTPPPPPPTCPTSCEDDDCNTGTVDDCSCKKTPKPGGECGGKPGKDSCIDMGMCEDQGGVGVCVSGEPRTSGDCNDNLACTENDMCKEGGACGGEDIEDEDQGNPIEQDFGGSINAYGKSFTRIATKLGVAEPEFDFKAKATLKIVRSCCEKKSTDKDNPKIFDNLEGSGFVSVSFDTGPVNIPVSGGILTALRSAAKKLGIKGKVDLGLDAQVGGTVRLDITSIKDDKCLDGINASGSGSISVDVGITAGLTGLDILMATAGANTGLSGKTEASGAGPGEVKLKSTVTWKGITLDATIEVLSRKIKILDKFPLVNPQSLPPGTATLSLPSI